MKMGINIKINPVGGQVGQIDVEDSWGDGKYHPGGPNCIYKEKQLVASPFSLSVVGLLLRF